MLNRYLVRMSTGTSTIPIETFTVFSVTRGERTDNVLELDTTSLCHVISKRPVNFGRSFGDSLSRLLRTIFRFGMHFSLQGFHQTSHRHIPEDKLFIATALGTSDLIPTCFMLAIRHNICVLQLTENALDSCQYTARVRSRKTPRNTTFALHQHAFIFIGTYKEASLYRMVFQGQEVLFVIGKIHTNILNCKYCPSGPLGFWTLSLIRNSK
jgi:hypothetical protein